jgi:hypothetical protein
MSKIARLLATCALALGVLLGVAPQAQAEFHLMKIREVSPGTGAAETGYVELQMIAPGQTVLMGHEVDFYEGAGGTLVDTCPLANVLNGENQRTIVVGDTNVPVGQKDVTCSDLNVDVNGGAVCFPDGDPPDCVSWGNFNAMPPVPLPSPTGTPEPGGLPFAISLRRSHDAGCATLMEGIDDTNDSANDFSLAPYDPTPNSAGPSGIACLLPSVLGPTTPTAPPKKKCKKKGKKKKAAAAKCKKKRKKR